MSTFSTPSTSGSKTIPRTSSPSTPSRPTAQWSPLTPSEARALIQSQRYPGTAPPFVLPPERRNMPQSEINRLSHIIGRENTLERTLHYIPDSSAVVPAHIVCVPKEELFRVLASARYHATVVVGSFLQNRNVLQSVLQPVTWDKIFDLL
ncbi:hypothetical protein K438DRAFT_1787162 [Mycena galopus ATCC 62051]|nr:hypothetical protein K438DRAFT_1787162 [Mycena galopus ATCC 62051]